MRFLVVFSGIIAIVPFLIGFVVSLFPFMGEVTWGDRLIFAAIPAFCTFIAALLLGSRDSARTSSIIQQVHVDLLSCNDSNDEQFLSCQPYEDADLLLEIRSAISLFFDVPAFKVSRDVDLLRDLQIDKLDFPFQFTVVGPVIKSRQDESKPFVFSMTNVTSIDDLANEIRNILE